MKLLMKRFRFVVLAFALVCTSMVLLGGKHVVNAATKAELSTKKETIAIGETYQLELNNAVKKVKWSSEDKSIATVSKTGLVTAKKAGKTNIIATCNNKQYKCKITVKTPKLNKKSLTLYEGGEEKLELSNVREDTYVEWSSSDENVVSVWRGQISAHKEGIAVITAKVGKNKYTCKVKVKKNPYKENIKVSEIKISPESIVSYEITNNNNVPLYVSWEHEFGYEEVYEAVFEANETKKFSDYFGIIKDNECSISILKVSTDLDY